MTTYEICEMQGGVFNVVRIRHGKYRTVITTTLTEAAAKLEVGFAKLLDKDDEERSRIDDRDH